MDGRCKSCFLVHCCSPIPTQPLLVGVFNAGDDSSGSGRGLAGNKVEMMVIMKVVVVVVADVVLMEDEE